MAFVPKPSMALETSIVQLPFVGSRNAAKLAKLNIKTIRQLLWHLPVRYDDFTESRPIAELAVGEKVNVRGQIVTINLRRIFPRRMTIVDAVVRDESGSIRAVWFNQPYIANQLVQGTEVSLAGKVTLNKQGPYLASPVYERVADAAQSQQSLRHTSGFVAKYPETEGISSKYLRFVIQPLLAKLNIPDPLPGQIRNTYNFPTLSEALHEVHMPTGLDRVDQAKERLAFDDLLTFQLKALQERRLVAQLQSKVVSFDQVAIKEFISKLPFTLTRDQKVATWEILKDIQRPFPMNRLLEGDVGSGKTVVALIAAFQVAMNGYQVVFMAPTEVLAQQHAQTITTLLKDYSLPVALMTGSEARLDGEEITKTSLKKQVAQGVAKIVIGTHAVIEKDVRFKNLALVVIDEQHRFGINQRAALANRQLPVTKQPIPHLLSMTATPIPRTLALTIFGDLDISLIKEKPKDRQPIITKVPDMYERAATYRFVQEQVSQGRQVFVICPRIESSANSQQPTADSTVKKPLSQAALIWSEVKAVQTEYKRLKEEIFPDLKIAMLHGKMKPKEKQQIMQEFKNGWHDILVSTSVVEVGVDVPNATIMIIESADRFGLAQLHQFRGRVGRAQHQSYCFLMTSSEAGAYDRLKILSECDDGFRLAEQDLLTRGPGEFFGVKQSGLPDLTMASLANVDLIKKARFQARTLLKADPTLKRFPLLKDRIAELQRLTHLE